MLVDFEKVTIYIKPGKTDMRKQINGLVIQAQEVMEKDPVSESLFLFCGSKRKLLKALYWDCNGFCLWQKKLEKDKFPWPESSETARVISSEQLHMLLAGIDFWRAHQKIYFEEMY